MVHAEKNLADYGFPVNITKRKTPGCLSTVITFIIVIFNTLLLLLLLLLKTSFSFLHKDLLGPADSAFQIFK